MKQRGKKALNDSSSHIKLEGELAHNHSIFEGFSGNESPRGLKTTSSNKFIHDVNDATKNREGGGVKRPFSVVREFTCGCKTTQMSPNSLEDVLVSRKALKGSDSAIFSEEQMDINVSFNSSCPLILSQFPL